MLPATASAQSTPTTRPTAPAARPSGTTAPAARPSGTTAPANRPATPAAAKPAAGAAAPAENATALQPGQVSVLSGVYTEAQAKNGQATVENICSACHQPTWFGGEEWKQHWAYGEVFWVYDFIRTNMPYGQPGSLGLKAYREVIAYMLKNAGYPAGPNELPTTDEGMMGIVFPTPNPPPPPQR
jgi:hypothetical protein